MIWLFEAIEPLTEALVTIISEEASLQGCILGFGELPILFDQLVIFTKLGGSSETGGSDIQINRLNITIFYNRSNIFQSGRQ